MSLNRKIISAPKETAVFRFIDMGNSVGAIDCWGLVWI